MWARFDDLVLVQGMDDTRRTLAAWNRAPWAVLRGWLGASLVVAIGLLAAVGVIGTLAIPGGTRLLLPGINAPAGGDDVAHILLRNSLVLALHGFACVAGFIAGSSLPLSAQRYSGTWRWIHDRAGPWRSASWWAPPCSSRRGQGPPAPAQRRRGLTTLCIVRPATGPQRSVMASIPEVTDNNFQAEVLESETPVLVDFWAPWCGPCRMVAPVLEQIADERGDEIKIVKLNVDENQQVAGNFQVMQIPTLIVFKGGQVAHTVIGAHPKKKLEAEIEPVLAA